MDFLSTPVIIGLSTILLIVFRPKQVLISIQKLPRDLKLIWLFVRLNVTLYYFIKTNATVPKQFRKIARNNPKKIAFYFEDQKWTFEQVDEYTNKIANYFKNLGYKKGDSIALLMDSKPEYICLWLGLAKIGVTGGLLNTNVMSREALAHAIKSCRSNSIIFGSRFKKVIENVVPAIPELKKYQFNDETSEILNGATDLKKEIEGASNSSVDSNIDEGKSQDTLIYIFTSGTTGLPKASIIRHSRYNLAYLLFRFGVEIEKEDVIYIPVPLYHSLGGMVAASQCLCTGSTLAIRTKFSASNFWKDCEKYKCTISPYIGEMVRYVLLAHQNSKEKPTYKLEKMFGNGMKPTTWKQFIEAFNIGQIFEFYGSTEGNFGLFNLDNTVGAVGYCPIYGDPFVPLALVKCNSSGEAIRNEQGYCDICDYDEAGLLICKISNLLPLTKFDGYSDKESTKKKILNDVLKEGDVYFNTGDVLTRDEYGYFYFKDRTGDTFRWKGENVSTNEVEDILSSLIQKDVAVYGVEVPGSEGKAGMAAIVDETKSLNFEKFLDNCKSNLPSYSIPIFLRIVNEIPKTGTFKIQKSDFRNDGFDIKKIKDNLYFLDPRAKKYVKITSELYDDIMTCKVRL